MQHDDLRSLVHVQQPLAISDHDRELILTSDLADRYAKTTSDLADRYAKTTSDLADRYAKTTSDLGKIN